MAFTPAHAAAVLPLVRRGWLLPSALVIGSMGPDLTFYIPLTATRVDSHSLTAAPTWTAALALAGWALWRWLLAAPIRDLMPAGVRARWAPAARVRGARATARLWLAAYVSVVLGTLTHLFWDGFTHRGDWAGDRLPELHVMVGWMPVYRWLQWVTSVVGFAVIALYVARRISRATPRPDWTARSGGPMLAWRVATLGALLVAPSAVAAWHLLAGSYLFVLLTQSLSVALTVAVVAALAWHALRVVAGQPAPVRQASMSASAAERTSSGARLARTDDAARSASASSSKP